LYFSISYTIYGNKYKKVLKSIKTEN